MAKIRSHQDLDVYQMAFQAAMEILRLPNNFRRKKNIPLPTRYDVLPVLCARTLRRHSESDNMQQLLLLKYMMQKQKRRRHKYGWIFVSNVATWTLKAVNCLNKNMNISLVNS